ncbi:hypothetical protein EI94DRAFT_1736541 [Lactarius quietus]|nr:hypothetical protein EI94DRAFT_1736541 [Lactarius quietus]
MSDIEHFSFPPSCTVSNEADVASDSQYLPLPTQNLNSPAQMMTDFTDGSDALFSMYNEMAAERDGKLAENWREDANAIMLLSGLISATSYLTSQTSSQDVSAFYLAQLYQLQAASSNSSGALPAPAPPDPVSLSSVTYMFWFASLVESLSTAVFATLIQEWVRRYQVMTQPLYSPHKNARIRAFITQQGSLVVLQRTVNILHAALHQSIFFFLLGLITLTSSGAPWVLVAVILYITLPVVLYLRFSLTPYSDPQSLFSTPFSGFLISLRRIPLLVLSLFRAITRRGRVDGLHRGTNTPAEVGWLAWIYTVKEIQKLAETRSSTLDTWAMSSLLSSVNREQQMEQFLAGIPGFYSSSQVENPTEVLRESNMDRLPKAIVAFMDNSLSSRSAVFTCVDFILLAEKHTDDDDPDVRFLARCIVAVAINRLGDYHKDKRWAGIAQRGLHWSESTFAEYREQRDSIQLRNLVQLVRELHIAHPDVNDPSTRTTLGYTLCVARQLKVENAALGLQHEFCELWNSLVASIHDQRQRPIVRSNAIFILSLIRTVYVTLHQSSESGPCAFSAFTDDLDPVLQKSSSYILCTVSSHRLSTLSNPTSNANVSFLSLAPSKS